MQIKAFYNDDDELIVEIPTSDGIHKGVFAASELNESSEEKPVVIVVPDITGNTQFGKPIGEMSVRDQELHSERIAVRSTGIDDARETSPITRNIQPVPTDEARAALTDVPAEQDAPEDQQEDGYDTSSDLDKNNAQAPSGNARPPLEGEPDAPMTREEIEAIPPGERTAEEQAFLDQNAVQDQDPKAALSKQGNKPSGTGARAKK